MRQYLLQHPELPRDATRFWVCDYAIRQADAKADVKRLGDCMRAIGHTVLLMEPWDDPMPLRRAYCIKEVYHTQASGAKRETLGDRHIDTLRSINNLGMLLKAQGDLAGAEVLYRAAANCVSLPMRAGVYHRDDPRLPGWCR